MFKKMVLIALVAALSVAALPATSVYASGLNDEATPPERTNAMGGERLESIWARQQKNYERLGKLFDRAETLTEKIQTLIEKASERGLDTTAVQAALDVFNEALKDAHPIYESAKGIINSHRGFDDEGKVTDREKAIETVKSLGEKLRDIRETTVPSGKALREAIKAFREANPRPERDGSQAPTFSPTS